MFKNTSNKLDSAINAYNEKMATISIRKQKIAAATITAAVAVGSFVAVAAIVARNPSEFLEDEN